MQPIWRFLFLLLATTATWAGDLPDPRLTPGARNPDVTQATIHETICVKGYTEAIRIPAYYTDHLKKQLIRQYGYAGHNPQNYELDHDLGLSLGGAPQDIQNLWPEPRNSEWGANKKEQLEFVLNKMVCAEEIPLAEAQNAMLTNWINAWKKYVPSHHSLDSNKKVLSEPKF